MNKNSNSLYLVMKLFSLSCHCHFLVCVQEKYKWRQPSIWEIEPWESAVILLLFKWNTNGNHHFKGLTKARQGFTQGFYTAQCVLKHCTKKNTYTGVVAALPINLICTRFAWHSSSSSSNEFRMPNFSIMASHWNFFSCKTKHRGKEMSLTFHCNVQHLHSLRTYTSKLLTSNNKHVRCRRDDKRAASGVVFICDILSSSCLVSELWLVQDFKTTPMSVVSWKKKTRLQ